MAFYLCEPKTKAIAQQPKKIELVGVTVVALIGKQRLKPLLRTGSE
ncbi:MAG: hypothetical protein ACI85U_003826 [Candidatus Promineifilaceae bacterium]|jgi:hypothetical protein